MATTVRTQIIMTNIEKRLSTNPGYPCFSLRMETHPKMRPSRLRMAPTGDVSSIAFKMQEIKPNTKEAVAKEEGERLSF